ncbi:MAG: four helix bundle protein [Bacteroidota bacterium]
MENYKEKENVIVTKTFNFALKIIGLYSILIKNSEYVLSKQLLKSGTSIGANVEESVAAQTKKEFISKMSISAKEARETRYWLRLLDRSQLVKYNYSSYLTDIEEIIRIITAIVKTSQTQIKK